MNLESILELHRSGDLAAAEAAYREYLSAQPDDAEALHLHGVLQQQRGDLVQADALIQRAIGLAPDAARFHLSLGGVRMRAGDDASALGSFERAMQLDPNLVEAHSLVGHLQLLEGDLGAAENRFRIGRRAAEDDPMILFGLGNVNLARNDAVNAAKFLARAAELKPWTTRVDSGQPWSCLVRTGCVRACRTGTRAMPYACVPI